MTDKGKFKVLLVAGARPNFMKIAPIYLASLAVPGVDCRIVHTGQHYDREMSQSFFDDLEIPTPAFFLEAGSGSHAVQTEKIMAAFEEVCEKEGPDFVMVVGDVNSTLACSIVAKKLQIQVAHVEAGLRSFDLSMPEEINREETTALGVPCVTIRENTERPITVEMGTNVLAGTSREGILKAVRQSMVKAEKASVPALWDGKAALRIWGVIQRVFGTPVKQLQQRFYGAGGLRGFHGLRRDRCRRSDDRGQMSEWQRNLRYCYDSFNGCFYFI